MFHIFGLPYFTVSGAYKTRPYGQEGRFAPYPPPEVPYTQECLPGVLYEAPKDAVFLAAFRQMQVSVAEEWEEIHSLLLRTGLEPKVMLAFEEVLGRDFVKIFRQGPMPTVNFPGVDMTLQRFPRDLWTYLPNGTVLMDLAWNKIYSGLNPACRLIDPTYTARRGIVDSVYGEGGRLMVRRSLAVVFERVEIPHLEQLRKRRYELSPAPTHQLREQGLDVLELPNVAVVTTGKGPGTEMFGVEEHVDRYFALIEDRKGGLHLLADPEIHSGFQGPNKPPKYNAGSTLNECRRRAIRAGVEFHRIKRIHHPLAMGVYQTAEGVVAMSCGEPELEQVITDLVGADRVVTSRFPLYKYGAWLYAGVRCLVNEAPDYFLDDPPRGVSG